MAGMKESEADFATWLKDTALTAGWLYYHTFDSRRSDEGFPDVVMIKDVRMIVAELKAEGQHPTPKQVIWLEAFRIAGRHPAADGLTAEVYLWYPHDRPRIMEILGLEVA